MLDFEILVKFACPAALRLFVQCSQIFYARGAVERSIERMQVPNYKFAVLDN
jgi:hypothetical protein